MTKIILFSFLLSILRIAISVDTISPGTAIRDGDTLVSNDQTFELGFFSPGSSTNRYVGIWYKKVSTGTVVWVANRETPTFDHYGVLHFTDQGTIILVNSTKGNVWSSNTTRTANSPIAQLLDSGNFIVRDKNDINPANYLWQSFDYPGDTHLPGMKIGRNFVTGQEWTTSSWKTLDDPARGEYSYGADLHGFPQLVFKRGNTTEYRVGSWNGAYFTSAVSPEESPIIKYHVVWNEKEASYAIELKNKSIIYRSVTNASGLAIAMAWMNHEWFVIYKTGEDRCENFAKCGPNGKCNTRASPSCSCLDGFKPKSDREWSYAVWSGGCVRQTPLSCGRGDGFVKHVRMTLPDTSSSWFNTSMSLKQCEKLCLKNCSCMAYSNTDIRNGGNGCLHWFNELVDIKESPDYGQEFYIRMAASYIDNVRSDGQSAPRKEIIMISYIVISFIAVLLIGVILFMRSKSRGNNQSGNQDLDLPIISLTDLVNATNNFSSSNMLGEGGFGPVYKGILTDGKEIAVKRLSMNSGQGVEEFKNEVLLIAKLQHRNLVKLLGCCIEGNETMLIYEFMPNKSLDHYIFDETKSELLDWPKRNNIIRGIARGLLYLHQDSRLRIIHRDLKASNVLLDIEKNPKISDFGLARTFGGDQTVIRTRRVVGTYGYMSPEYAIDGSFSTKSDIFSFGVLLLEIVSGKKNRGFSHPNHGHNLLGHAWILWNEGRPVELITDLLSKTIVLQEMLRCIHVGLLCVQHKPEDRPSMSSVVVMLDSETALPEPKQPGFFTERRILDSEGESSSRKQKSSSSHSITLSELKPR